MKNILSQPAAVAPFYSQGLHDFKAVQQSWGKTGCTTLGSLLSFGKSRNPGSQCIGLCFVKMGKLRLREKQLVELGLGLALSD